MRNGHPAAVPANPSIRQSPHVSTPVRRRWHRLARSASRQRPLDQHRPWTRRDLPATHDRASANIKALDQHLKVGLEDWTDQRRLLETVPGIDRGSACAILAELGPDLTGYRSAGHIAAWAGVAPGNNESAGKRRSARVRRGDPTLRATLAECAHAAVRTMDTQFQRWHQAHMGRLNYKQSILAVAHKMLRTILAMLRDNEPYRNLGIAYEELVMNRNASRCLAKLEQYSYLERIQAAAGPDLQTPRENRSG